MKKLLQKKAPQILGLDIGTRYVKAVLLTKTAQSCEVDAVACEPIAGNAFADRDIKDFDAVSNAIKKVKMALKIKSKDVAVAVSGSTVISKIVYMDPNLSDLDLESQIEIEADSLIPYPLDEVYVDFEQLGQSQAHEEKVDVLLSAAHKDMVDSRVTLLREVTFEPKVVDIEGFALGNAIKEFAAPELVMAEDAKPMVCINIGASQLLVTVFHQQRVAYTKEHTFGMEALLQDLAIILSMDKQEAESQLLKEELPTTWREQVLPAFVSNLAQQIGRALQVYISTTRHERPQTIHICGGGAVLSGICEELASELAVDVALFNPFGQMQLSEVAVKQGADKLAPQLAIAAGLASRGFYSWHM
ncbi:type IV pilus assembly protein PilM [Neptunicella marina]|uniref:Type IV pilus assembly protein PilM n=1 Tax=Neptunicella marina TaxID=2125989 RepID=A0A8J6M159_9ALTE|nr:type IV pilus assembly protein PilM [Neptunicella marina]MBC3767619.1 type IV pilus assembly protein PilM [Neptunicella marina]